MASVELAKGVYWVGAIDWNLRSFHGWAGGAVKAVPGAEELAGCFESGVGVARRLKH